MSRRVFIDGSAGTTGLRIRERLSARDDLELVVLPDDIRKDPSARRDALNSCDVAFLCLPDDAAREAVAMVENDATVVIDTSTAHRTADGWAYGFPELAGMREIIASSRRIANPGCHASGLVALVAPLVTAGVLAPDAKLAAFSLTGYSGGGKKMIADYEANEGELLHLGGRQYALGQFHKHLPEMVKVCGLAGAPVFAPIVVPHLSGMETTVMVHGDQLRGGLAAARECLRTAYGDTAAPKPGLVRYAEDPSEGGFLSSAALSGRDGMVVSAHGNDDRVILVARFDNLGKGASGAAIQNMNIVIGVEETRGLVP